jgi:hypothetical protein
MNTLFDRLRSALGGKRGGGAAGAAVDAPPAAPAAAPAVFEAGNELERLLMAAALDPARRVAFQQALLQADLFAGTVDAPAREGWRTTGAGETLRLVSVTGADGAAVPATFTSQARVAEVLGPEARFVQMNGARLLEMLARDGAVLNPGLGYSVQWSAQELAGVLGGPVARTLAAGTDVLLGSPARRPEALIKDLSAVLGADRRIEAAWLALAQWPAAGESAWYLDVRTRLAPDEVNALLAGVFQRADFAGRPLDMVVKAPGGGDGVGIAVAPG